MRKLKRIPRHIGIIPDGNRRWAQIRGLPKERGYEHGIEPGKRLFEEVCRLGIKEVSFYVFTQENTKRSPSQVDAFRQACLRAVHWLKQQDVSLLVVGDAESPLFPAELKELTRPANPRNGKLRVNFLVNYSWTWDLRTALAHSRKPGRKRDLLKCVGSREVSRIDLVIRWGNRRRLSGFLPLQSAYADIFVVDELWPDFQVDQFHRALEWFAQQDVTMGG